MPSPVAEALAYAHKIAQTLALSPGNLALHAVIVHGSIGFGDYVPGRSDLDMLIVGDVPPQGIHEVATSIIAVPTTPDLPRLECSLVSPEDIASPSLNPLHPLHPLRPFRLHLNLHDPEPRIVPGHEHAGDQDLTLHYAVARTNGITIWGTPAHKLLPTQPPALITQALLSELQWATEYAEPPYTILNAARAWAFAQDSVLLSKIGGWLWARRHAAPTHLLDLALTAYLTPQTGKVRWPAHQPDIDRFINDVKTALQAALPTSP